MKRLRHATGGEREMVRIHEALRIGRFLQNYGDRIADRTLAMHVEEVVLSYKLMISIRPVLTTPSAEGSTSADDGLRARPRGRRTRPDGAGRTKIPTGTPARTASLTVPTIFI